MKETEEHLLARNQVAASIGQEIVLEQLRKIREQFVSQAKTIVPTNSDPYGINLHRAIGRVDALDYLINLGETSTKQQKG